MRQWPAQRRDPVRGFINKAAGGPNDRQGPQEVQAMGFTRGRHGVAVSVLAAAWLAACGGGGEDTAAGADSAQVWAAPTSGSVTAQAVLPEGANAAAKSART